MNFNDFNEDEIYNRCSIVNVIDYFRHEVFLFFSVL